MVISWVLAFAALCVALLNFRRSRYPRVKFYRLVAECYAGLESDWKYHMYFHLHVLSTGADVFDLKVFLECDHSYRHHGRKIPLLRKFEFEPLDAVPSPFRNGQVLRMRLSDKHFRNLEEQHYADTRTPADLSPSRVRLVAYHSGGRELAVRSSWRFRKVVKSFCMEVPTRG